jgi:hypothetical protein
MMCRFVINMLKAGLSTRRSLKAAGTHEGDDGLSGGSAGNHSFARAAPSVARALPAEVAAGDAAARLGWPARPLQMLVGCWTWRGPNWLVMMALFPGFGLTSHAAAVCP